MGFIAASTIEATDCSSARTASLTGTLLGQQLEEVCPITRFASMRWTAASLNWTAACKRDVLQLCGISLVGDRVTTDIRGQANFSEFLFATGQPGIVWCHIVAFAVRLLLQLHLLQAHIR